MQGEFTEFTRYDVRFFGLGFVISAALRVCTAVGFLQKPAVLGSSTPTPTGCSSPFRLCKNRLCSGGRGRSRLPARSVLLHTSVCRGLHRRPAPRPYRVYVSPFVYAIFSGEDSPPETNHNKKIPHRGSVGDFIRFWITCFHLLLLPATRGLHFVLPQSIRQRLCRSKESLHRR